MEENIIEINVSPETIDESFLAMFGGAVKSILRGMFGKGMPNVKIKGKKSDVKSFADTLNSEKKYMDTYIKYGLDSPRTYRNKGKLQRAVSKFERKTGLKWPLE